MAAKTDYMSPYASSFERCAPRVDRLDRREQFGEKMVHADFERGKLGFREDG
jgi:hypothetical protein